MRSYTVEQQRDPDSLTPVELRNGLWYKREDLHRNEYGVNGAKFRACRHMLVNAVLDGYEHVVSAQSVLSPQSSICATLCEELGIGCTVVYGASSPETAIRHPNVRIAMEAGAEMDTQMRVAYNGVIQPHAAKLAKSLGAWQLPYAISLPASASEQETRDFLRVGGRQVRNIPDEVDTLVLPFGSGNTTAGVLHGLATGQGGHRVRKVVLVGIGPDRREWMFDRLEKVGVAEAIPELEYIPLQHGFATYGDQMKETLDDIVLHPTYEGKVARYLNIVEPDWWLRRDGSTMLWIVGGPLS